MTPNQGAWSWGLELASYRFAAQPRTLNGSARVTTAGPRVAYQWDEALAEWYVNDQRGLEHGFTLNARPGQEAGPLEFRLAVRGGLRPQVQADGQGVRFVDQQGGAVVNYTGLKVWDADGKTLVARFEPPVAGQTTLRLAVEESGARYPLTIDPIAQQAYLKASNTGAGDQFGISVAVSGDTVVVGANREDSSTTGVNSTPDESASASGAAYIFTGLGPPNTAPTITPMAQTVVKSSSVPNLKIATVNDAEDAKNTLAVTISSDGVNFNPSATLNGVTINSISVDSSGNVTATISTTASATSASFTLKVTDSGGLTATDTLMVTVNKADTTTAITADSPDPSVVGQMVTIAYTVTPVAPATGTPTGNVMVMVNASTSESCMGTVAAGSCAITFNTAGPRTLTATYAGDATFNGSLSATEAHNVQSLPQSRLDKLNPTDPLLCAGQVINGSFGQSNNTAGPLSGRVFVTLQNLVALPSSVSCALTPAAGGATTFCAVENGAPTWRGTLAAGQSVTVTYQAQVSDAASGNAPVCSTAQAQFPDVTGTIIAATPFCLTLNCPAVGPGTPPPAAVAVSDQKPGSVLFYNLYTSNPADLTRQNTRINLTNTDPARSIAVHLFFVDGATCTPADSYLCLTPNQTVSFLASDIDPGTTGYIVAVASDSTTGCPINFNFLIGDEFVKLSSGHTANLAAESFAALAGGLPLCNATAGTATLNFDGVSYNQAPRVLAVDNFPSTADGNNTLLILNRVGGDLRNGTSNIGSLFGVLYDEAEQPFSFSLASNTCQFRLQLANSALRTTQRLETVISAGRTGWLRLWGVNDIGLLGAVINLNSNAGVNNFSQGHNLHKLTFTSASLTIPIIPPAC